MTGEVDSGALTTGKRLHRIEDRLDTIIGRMDKLAEEADLRALTARVDLLERDGSVHARHAEAELVQVQARLTALETTLAVATALRSSRRWMIGVAIGLAGWAAVVVAVAAIVQGRHP